MTQPPRRRLTKAEIDAVPDKDKLGKHKHIGRLIGWFETGGGLRHTDENGKARTVASQMFEPDEIEQGVLEGRIPLEEVCDENGRYRPWRVIQTEKLRCGQKSATPIEAQWLWEEGRDVFGPDFACLFTPEALIKTHPAEIIETVMVENIPLTEALNNPLLLLRVLAEIADDPRPRFNLLDPSSLRLASEGDDRSEGMELIRKPITIYTDQCFVLQAETGWKTDCEALLFQYGSDEMARRGDNKTTLCLPMRYTKQTGPDVLAFGEGGHPLTMTGALGHFGFGAIIAPKGTDIYALIDIDPDQPYWSADDLARACTKLRHVLAKSTMPLSIGLLDYEKRER